MLTTPALPTISRPNSPTSVVFLDNSGNNDLPPRTESFSSQNLLVPISTSSETKRPEVASGGDDFPEESELLADEKLQQPGKPHLQLQTQTLGTKKQTETKTTANKDKHLPEEEEDTRQTSKPFQVFRKPTVLQGKLVPFTADVKPKSRPEEARNPTLERENSGSAKQEFTAFRKPPRPSGKPRKTLGRAESADGSDIENNLGSHDNEQEVIRQSSGGVSTTLPEEINTFFSGEISPTRKPKTFSAQTFNRVPAETRNGGKGGKQIVFQTPTSSPGRFQVSPGSKRVIFQDSTIAVSPGSVPVAPETITLGSLLEDPGPTLQLPFVIEGTAGQTGGRPGAGDDVSIPIVIQEKEEEEEERGKGKIKVMTEIEFENQFGRSTTAPSSLGPLQQVVNPLFPFIFQSNQFIFSPELEPNWLCRE